MGFWVSRQKCWVEKCGLQDKEGDPKRVDVPPAVTWAFGERWGSLLWTRLGPHSTLSQASQWLQRGSLWCGPQVWCTVGVEQKTSPVEVLAICAETKWGTANAKFKAGCRKRNFKMLTFCKPWFHQFFESSKKSTEQVWGQSVGYNGLHLDS